MGIKKSFFLVTALSCTMHVFSQDTGIEIARSQYEAKKIIPPSPEAAELGRYGNMSVSLFTGTPNISIPLVELTGKQLSLPVSLSYNASGFKPEDLAPWTGLGWALNAGGVITRSVLGDPDVASNYFYAPSAPLDPVPTNEYSKQVYFNDIQQKTLETQPDIYYYNFMGHSGKFLINPAGQIFKKEKDMLSISNWTPSYDDNTFTIYDDRGMKYEFTEMEKTSIYPVPDYTTPHAPPAIDRHFNSAWYLSKVTSADLNEELIFEYYTPANAQSTISSSVSNRSITYSITDDGSSTWAAEYNVHGVVNEFASPATSITRKFIKKVSLKQNGTITGFVDFESGVNERLDLGPSGYDGERLLKRVKLYSVQNSSNTLLRDFSMGYEYFGASQSNTLGCKRLKLKTVQELAPDVSVIDKPPYTVYYKNESSSMPVRYTSALDHWGFYNGNTNVNGAGAPTLLPTIAVTAPHLNAYSRGEGANREADYDYGSSFCMIEKLTYPTGGYTTFLFEGNDGYAAGSSVYSAIGGARIKKMTDYSSAGAPATVKEYEYKLSDGYTSSGHGSYSIKYDDNSEYQELKSCPGSYNSTTYSVTIGSNSIYGLGSINGSHIGYERVTEYQKDYTSGLSLGRTVYTYEIVGYSEIDDNIGNGDLKTTEVYDASNKLLHYTKNTYQYDYGMYMLNRRLIPQGLQTSNTQLCMNGSSYSYYDPSACFPSAPSCGSTRPVPTQYQVIENDIFQQAKWLMSQETKTYDQLTSNYIITKKNFTYGSTNHNYPTLVEEFNSTNEKVFTSMKYVADYTGISSPATGSIEERLGQMQGAYIKTPVVEQLQYRTDISGGSKRYISGKITDYLLGNPFKLYFLETNTPPSTVTISGIVSGSFQYDNTNYRLAATMLYDDKMNLIQQSKVNDVPVSFVWGYNKRFPVAQITGRTYSSLSGLFSQTTLDNPASTEATIKTELSTLRSSLSSTIAQVNSVTYKPMVGISTQTDARGRVTSYEYDGFSRLILVRDNDNKILKKLCYNYAGQTESCPLGTGCNSGNSGADWQNTATAVRCKQSGGVNTGYQEQEQKDMNPCSATYNQTQWVQTVYNTTACPLPSTCSSCTGPDKKCINGVCETGTLIVVSTRRVKVFDESDDNPVAFHWVYYCSSAYCFSDGSTSTPVETVSSGFCTTVICL